MINYDVLPEPELRKLYEISMSLRKTQHQILELGDNSHSSICENSKVFIKFSRQLRKCIRISNRNQIH
jgi:hypothetical protein